jgi:hypothetical protein
VVGSGRYSSGTDSFYEASSGTRALGEAARALSSTGSPSAATNALATANASLLKRCASSVSCGVVFFRSLTAYFFFFFFMAFFTLGSASASASVFSVAHVVADLSSNALISESAPPKYAFWTVSSPTNAMRSFVSLT